MLDADLAKIYGYSTKAFNQQVKNNIEKFEEDFMFLLTDEEVKELSRSKILTLNITVRALKKSIKEMQEKRFWKEQVVLEEDIGDLRMNKWKCINLFMHKGEFYDT